MYINRPRVAALGLLALLAVGSLGASTAYGEAGPFWHHRPIGGEGAGEKIEAKSPASFSGEGSEQIMVGKIAGASIEIAAKSVQAKGIFFNNSLQGQLKLLQKYHEPRLVKPSLNGCEVKLGTNNELDLVGHLAWKYRGVANELTEKPVTVQKPSGVGTPVEIAEGATKLPEGTITEITLSGSGCGVVAGRFPVKGSISAFPKPENLGEWSTTASVTFSGWKQLHFWNGKEQVAVEPGLIFGGNVASYSGTSTVSIATQEVAVFEK